mmetsp:Transcript_13457/g.32890  ORF Transcript_13457/g.32890 Transcript_13457/m.32890 type:complete len:232 (-) Transcript_13457:277-972(-)
MSSDAALFLLDDGSAPLLDPPSPPRASLLAVFAPRSSLMEHSDDTSFFRFFPESRELKSRAQPSAALARMPPCRPPLASGVPRDPERDAARCRALLSIGLRTESVSTAGAASPGAAPRTNPETEELLAEGSCWCEPGTDPPSSTELSPLVLPSLAGQSAGWPIGSSPRLCSAASRPCAVAAARRAAFAAGVSLAFVPPCTLSLTSSSLPTDAPPSSLWSPDASAVASKPLS